MSEAKEEKKTKVIKIAHLMIGRCEEGVEIKIKSPVIEEFIKSVYTGGIATAQTAEWCKGEKFYKPPASGQPIELTATRHSIQTDRMDNNELITREDMLNLSFIRIVGIKDGKSFKFRGLYRETDIEGIAQSINEALKNLFKDYNTPIAYEIEIASEV